MHQALTNLALKRKMHFICCPAFNKDSMSSSEMLRNPARVHIVQIERLDAAPSIKSIDNRVQRCGEQSQS